MRTATITLVLATALAVACSDRHAETPDSGPPASPAPTDGWPEPVGGPAYAPDGYGSRLNSTEEEEAVRRDASACGRLLVKLTDDAGGEPMAKCNFGAFKYSLQRGLVDRKNSPRVTRRGAEDHPDGIHPFTLSRGFYRLRLTSPTYRNTWTPIFEIHPGEETRLAIRMMLASRIVVTVLDENGEPLAKGAVMLRSKEGMRASLVIKNGRGERLVDVDELFVEVGTTFLKEYAVQRVPVSLTAGGTTEVEVCLTR